MRRKREGHERMSRRRRGGKKGQEKIRMRREGYEINREGCEIRGQWMARRQEGEKNVGKDRKT